MARRIPRSVKRQLLALTFAATAFAQQSALDSISAASLRANVTYLASDELEGRDTPSRGLDKAADYIADQFKKDRKSIRLNSSHT